MAEKARRGCVALGDCVLDRDARVLTRAGREQRLSPKAYALLEILLDAAPRALSKPELMELLWPDTFVVEANLSNLVSELRAALRDDPARPHLVRTLHGYGYAFTAPSTAAAAGASPSGAPARRYVLFVERTAFVLGPGEHVLGRGADSAVPLLASAVSRRHARLVLDGPTAVLCDLGSRNGTFVCGQRVERAVTLRSGDEIRLGPVRLSLDTWTADTTQDDVSPVVASATALAASPVAVSAPV
jgi:DNA-binding winged helix-turn-helix (wHTH) protein